MALNLIVGWALILFDMLEPVKKYIFVIFLWVKALEPYIFHILITVFVIFAAFSIFSAIFLFKSTLKEFIDNPDATNAKDYEVRTGIYYMLINLHLILFSVSVFLISYFSDKI